ncbi:MAG: tetratricopeptide repeat protein, partial [Alphaproteobacteria bacterium]
MVETVQIAARRRKLTAILDADVAGFSRLMGEDESGTHQALSEMRRAVDPLITDHGGRIVGTAGDSLLADFASVVDALDCAVAIQQAAVVLNEPIPPARRLELRIGVNLGDVIVDGDDIFGDGVNIAARLQELRPPRRRHTRSAISIAGALAILVLAAWALHAGIGERLGIGAPAKPVEVASLAAPARLAGRTSVAVLPFKNLSEDAGQEYFSDGISEDVATALGRFSNLLVAAKAASFAYKGRNLSPAEIGRLLDAQYLLGGSVRRAGDRVRVGVELTEAATGRLVWSDNYDGETKDIFAVQQDIAQRVVGSAAVKLTRFERERVLAGPTENLAAYEYVLRGREFLSHATREQNDEAQTMFERATALDPNFAGAYAALGRARYEAVISGWTEFRETELEQAEALARKALTLDPMTTNAYRLLANVYFYRKRYELALSQTDRALEINPSDVESYDMRGTVLVFAGRAAEALPWLEGALRFDRTDLLAAFHISVTYYFLGRYAEAIAAGDRALARSPGRIVHTTIHPFLAAAYAEMGRDQDAQSERFITLRLSPFFDSERFAAQFG